MSRPMKNTERINVHLSKELLESLKHKAIEKGMTVSGYVRLLVIEDTKECISKV